MSIPPLPARIVRTIRERNLLNPGETVIAALSGGADSCALLDLLATLPDFPLRLIAAHLNHGLRGAESDADEDFCRNMAERYGIRFESRQVNVAERADRQGLNLEEAGRQARIDFFREIRVTFGARCVALGHHADDQAETVLMRLLRGSGMTGLAGMHYANDFDHIRPLLAITRAEIEHHLTARNLPWREDASNRDTTFLRNRIRHELLPLLEQYNSAIRDRLAATAAIIDQDNNLLASLTKAEYDAQVFHENGAVAFNAAALTHLHPALLNRVIRHAVSEVSGNLRNLSHRHITDIRALLADGLPNRFITLPGALRARREYERILLYRAGHSDEITPHVIIDGPGRYPLWDGMILDVRPARLPDRSEKTSADGGCFDLHKAPFPWCVRTFNPGDRMSPAGMTGSKKVKDIFIDQKVPRDRRRRIPLVFSDGNLIWICGLRFSACAALSDDSSLIAQALLISQSR